MQQSRENVSYYDVATVAIIWREDKDEREKCRNDHRNTR